MGQLNFKKFYKYYINSFLQNKQIKHLFYKIINHNVFKNDNVLKNLFLNHYFFTHPYFQSKFLFYYKRKIWSLLMTKNISNLEKMEIWNISQNYLKMRIDSILNNLFHKSSNLNIFSFIKNENDKISIKQLISDLNKIFLFKGLIDKKSVIQSVNEYRFNSKLPTSILRTTLGFFSKKRLRLFNLNHEFNKKYNINLKLQNKNESNILLQNKIEDFRRNMYLNTAFLVIRLKLNNIFLTALDYKGNTIYQCSGGFYDTKGQNRMNSNTISTLSQRMSIELKRMHNIDKLVILYKSGFTNKLVKSTIHGLKTTELSLLGSIYGYNRPTTFLRKRKTRRV